MRTTGRCPKCDHGRIAGPYNIHTGQNHAYIDLSGFSTAKMDAYARAGCGHTEFFVDAKGLDNIRTSGRHIDSPSDFARYLKRQAPQNCSVCGQTLSESYAYCPNCGSKAK